MTDNIFGDDFDFDPDFDTKHLNPDNKDKKSNDDTLTNLEKTPLQDSSKSEEDHDDLEELDWSSDQVDSDKKSTVDDSMSHTQIPELNTLLDEYGIDTEIKESSNVDERIDKMRQRVISQTPTAKEEATKNSMSSVFLWLIGCVILLTLLVVQYSIFNINTIVKNPEHRQHLAKVCQVLSCHLPSADLKAIQIVRIRHRPSTINTSTNNVDLMAAIMNTSDHAQLYPNLKVTIYGKEGKVGEFVAPPEKYMTIKQTQLFNGQARPVMFTVSLKNQDIRDIEIKPFY